MLGWEGGTFLILKTWGGKCIRFALGQSDWKSSYIIFCCFYTQGLNWATAALVPNCQ